MDRATRAKNNICYDCHNKAKLDFKRCEKHLVANKLRASEYQKRPRGIKTREAYTSTSVYKAKDVFNVQKYKRTKGRFISAKGYAKDRDVEWTLSKEEYLHLISNPCDYCSLVNDVQTGVGLDRIDNSKGYSIENCVSCCAICNMTRGNRFSAKEMKQIGLVIREIKLRRASNAS